MIKLPNEIIDSIIDWYIEFEYIREKYKRQVTNILLSQGWKINKNIISIVRGGSISIYNDINNIDSYRIFLKNKYGISDINNNIELSTRKTLYI